MLAYTPNLAPSLDALSPPQSQGSENRQMPLEKNTGLYYSHHKGQAFAGQGMEEVWQQGGGPYLPAMSGFRRTTMTESPRRNILEM